jgi:hypothetical protein
MITGYCSILWYRGIPRCSGIYCRIYVMILWNVLFNIRIFIAEDIMERRLLYHGPKLWNSGLFFCGTYMLRVMGLLSELKCMWLLSDFLEPILLVTLFAPASEVSAAAALGALYYFALAHQVRSLDWQRLKTILCNTTTLLITVNITMLNDFSFALSVMLLSCSNAVGTILLCTGTLDWRIFFFCAASTTVH